jgi:hypothetical protein
MASSCACLVSLGTLHATHSGRLSDLNGMDMLALITCSLSFIIGLVMALGMRIGPGRLCFTKPLGGEERRRRESGRSCVANVTLELLLLSFLLFLWTLSISTLVDGTSTDGVSIIFHLCFNWGKCHHQSLYLHTSLPLSISFVYLRLMCTGWRRFRHNMECQSVLFKLDNIPPLYIPMG